jgi:hypothetical protein
MFYLLRLLENGSNAPMTLERLAGWSGPSRTI